MLASWRSAHLLVVLAGFSLLTGCASAPSRSSAPEVQVELLSVVEIPPVEIDGVPLGGLSGLTYDAKRDLFYAISDDGGEYGPPRFYTLRLDLRSAGPPGVEVVGWTALDGLRSEDTGIDLEGIALSREETLWISSEGDQSRGYPPFVAEFGLDGRLRQRLSFPSRFHPSPGGSHGIRHNMGPEALTLGPEGRYLYAGFEGTLQQDGAQASELEGGWVRWVRFDLFGSSPPTEWVYWVEAIRATRPRPQSFAVRGLVELQALSDGTFLAMEREYVEGVGNTVELFHVDPRRGAEVSHLPSLRNRPRHGVEKRHILDLGDLVLPGSLGAPLPLDNYEALALGPELEDGRRSLLIVSDDNFNQLHQKTWLVLLAVE